MRANHSPGHQRNALIRTALSRTILPTISVYGFFFSCKNCSFKGEILAISYTDSMLFNSSRFVPVPYFAHHRKIYCFLVSYFSSDYYCCLLFILLSFIILFFLYITFSFSSYAYIGKHTSHSADIFFVLIISHICAERL